MNITYENVAQLTGALPFIYVNILEEDLQEINVAIYKTILNNIICVASMNEIPNLNSKRVFPIQE